MGKRTAGPSLAALILCGCAGAAPQADPDPVPTPQAQTPAAEGPTATAPAATPAAAPPGPQIRELEPKHSERHWALGEPECEAHLSIEGGRMRWWTESSTDSPDGDCAVLSPALKGNWISLADHARKQMTLPAKLGLIVSFRKDLKSVEAWFRYQAQSKELQKQAGGPEAATYRLLADHMLSSGALSRYASLLQAMGLPIDHVSVEKVETKTPRGWAKRYPDSESWQLPSRSFVSLPNLTWLELHPK